MRTAPVHAHLHTYTQPTQLFAAGTQLAAHSQPALRTGFMTPAWCLTLCTLGVILILTCLVRRCPQRGLAATHRSDIAWVYVAVCNVPGVPPLEFLGQ